ncbi:MAG: hypothetical protein P4L45_06845 [Ignavibacteriaceae bacterium]|nr:hypothetical protein [Ignavibacteriaceae bacterium]
MVLCSDKRGTVLFKILLLLTFVLVLTSRELNAQENYFYTGKDYGSESLFNPITLMINGGYDVAQLQNMTNRIGDFEYGRMLHVVLKNLGDPFNSIRHYGSKKFFTTEFFPASFKRDDLEWIPNYQQHLLGGGMLFTSMKEWYTMHGYPYPWLLSAVTLMTHHMLNEVIESGPNEGWSVDEISDIYVFDLGGIILFSFDPINEFFSKKLILRDWSLQATVTLPNGRINAGQYFMMKWPLPFAENTSLFYRCGMGALFGLSNKVNETDSFSYGVGFKTKHLVDLNTEVRERTIESSWHAGVFYDRNNSLLASVVMSGVKEYFCSIDVYPGIIKFDKFSPGLWTIISRNGEAAFGITTRYVFSIGYDFDKL